MEKPWSRITLPAEEESRFQQEFRASPFFQEFQERHKEEPHLDGDYDYRLWWKDGMQSTREKDGLLHGPSKTKDGKWLKAPNHPTSWKQHFLEKTGKNPDELGLTEEQALNYNLGPGGYLED